MRLACETWLCTSSVNYIYTLRNFCAFSREQVMSKEKSTLNKLQWNFTVLTVYMFIIFRKSGTLPRLHFIENETNRQSSVPNLYVHHSIHESCNGWQGAGEHGILLWCAYAGSVLDVSPSWSDTMKHRTGLAELQLLYIFFLFFCANVHILPDLLILLSERPDYLHLSWTTL